MNKLIIAVLILFSVAGGTVTAQKNDSYDYKNAVGVKFYPGAITIKHFLRDNLAVEGISYFYGNSVRLTGLLEFHFDITTVPGLKWYVGPGAHVTLARYRNNGYTFVGIDGVLGLDYKFGNIPLNLSVDWQPSFEFGDDPYINGDDRLKNGPGFTGSWAGLGVRYVF